MGFSERMDFFFNKLIPKKLLIIVLASIFVFMGKLGGDMWAYLAMIYMSANGLQHLGFNVAEIAKSRK